MTPSPGTEGAPVAQTDAPGRPHPAGCRQGQPAAGGRRPAPRACSDSCRASDQPRTRGRGSPRTTSLPSVCPPFPSPSEAPHLPQTTRVFPRHSITTRTPGEANPPAQASSSRRASAPPPTGRPGPGTEVGGFLVWGGSPLRRPRHPGSPRSLPTCRRLPPPHLSRQHEADAARGRLPGPPLSRGCAWPSLSLHAA